MKPGLPWTLSMAVQVSGQSKRSMVLRFESLKNRYRECSAGTLDFTEFGMTPHLRSK
jgi:hypothetical protein